MKHQATLLAVASAVAGTLLAPHSKAVTYTDALTSPNSNDMNVMRSALTGSPQVSDQRNDPVTPYIAAGSQGNWGNGARFAAAYQTMAQSIANNAGVSEAYLAFDSQVTAFNEAKDVVLATMYDITDGPNHSANVYAQLYVGGNQVRSASRGGGVFNIPTGLTSVNQGIWTTGEYPIFTLGPVALYVTAALSGTASQVVQGRIWHDGTKATFTQSAAVTATAGVGVKALGASAGIKLQNLRLIQAGQTLNATAQFIPCNTVTVGESASLFLQELGGSIVAWASVPFAGSYESTIASWPGLTQTSTIVNAPPTTRAFSTPCFSVSTPPSI